MTKRKEKMTDDTLLTIIKERINKSNSTSDSGDLGTQVEKALKYYNGDLFGNEIEGRSQAILTDVRDTIEWAMPMLVKIFAGTDQVMRFDPLPGEPDSKQADAETQKVNDVFYKDNNGFLILYTIIKDALLSKLGVAKVTWEETEETKRESYEGVNTQQLQMLLSMEGIEPVEYTQTGQDAHSITVLRTAVVGRCEVVAIPPEEFLISEDARTVFPSDAKFSAHRVKKTKSELREEGFSDDDIEQIGADSWVVDSVESARDWLQSKTSNSEADLDKSMREVTVYECYLMVDYDGDGIAELRKITVAGNHVLLNEPVEDNPFIAITPIILTHKCHGLSWADLLMDLQLYKSTMLRQALDNLYSGNNQRTAIDANNVNLDDLLTSRPQGVVRCTGNPAMSIMPIPVGDVASPALNMMNYMDEVKATRTGIDKMFQGQGQNFNVAGDTAHGIERIMTAAEQKIELVARVFAETGIKDLFSKIRKLLIDNGNTGWPDRPQMTIKVGLGTGDKTKQLMAFDRIMALQEKAVAAGMAMLVTPKNIYNAAIDMARAAGMPAPEQYFSDPDQAPPPAPPQPDITLLIAQMEADLRDKEAQQRLLIEKGKAELEVFKVHSEAEDKDKDRQLKREIEAAKLQVEVAKIEQDDPLAGGQKFHEADLKDKELELKAAGMQADYAIALERLSNERAKINMASAKIAEQKEEKDRSI